MGFEGRTALVTSGTGGIGQAIVAQLAEAGATVLVNGENGAECARVVAETERAVAMPANLSDRAQVADLAARLLERGPLDHLALNAGITSRLDTEDPGYEQEVARVFDVNLHHVRMLCDKLLPAMGAQGGGSVVITASLAALRGNGGIGVYSLTKAALVQLARDAAVQ